MRIKHGKIRITCRITVDQYHPSGLKALGLILVSRDDTTYDMDFAMYYSLYNIYVINGNHLWIHGVVVGKQGETYHFQTCSK